MIIGHEYPFDNVDATMRAEFQDNLRSWRHLLSVSNRGTWLELRKKLMPWTLLSKAYSRKYLQDENFRNLLLNKMISSHHQLSFYCSSISKQSRLNANLRI